LTWLGPYVTCTEPRRAIIGEPRAMLATTSEQETVALAEILFPRNAPAGWDLSQAPPTDLGDQKRSRIDAKKELCRCAADLFEAAIADGLLPSEAADVVVQSPAFTDRREQFLWLSQQAGHERPDRIKASRAFPRELWAVSRDIG